MHAPPRTAHALTLAVCVTLLTVPLSAEPAKDGPERAMLPALELAPVDAVPVEITVRPCEVGMRFELEDLEHETGHAQAAGAWGDVKTFTRDQRVTVRRHATLEEVDAQGGVVRFAVEIGEATLEMTYAVDDTEHETLDVAGRTYTITRDATVRVVRDDGVEPTGRELDHATGLGASVVCPDPWVAALPAGVALEPGARFLPDAEAVARAHTNGSTIVSVGMTYRGVREVNGATLAVFGIEYVRKRRLDDGTLSATRTGELVVDPSTGQVVSIVALGEVDFDTRTDGRRVVARGTSRWDYRAAVVWP